MTVLDTRLNTRSDSFRQNAAQMEAVVADLRAQVARANLGGDEAARAKHVARGKLLPRERLERLLDPGAPFLELSQLAAHGLYGDEVPAAGHDHRHRAGIGARMRGRRQRRHGQGRHLLSADGEEAPARAGRGAHQSAALHLPRRFRRRQPAEPGRGVSRPGRFRPHLLQSGDHVGRGHPADRGGHGLLHGRRRLCAGDVGRGDHRQATRARSSSAARRW